MLGRLAQLGRQCVEDVKRFSDSPAWFCEQKLCPHCGSIAGHELLLQFLRCVLFVAVSEDLSCFYSSCQGRFCRQASAKKVQAFGPLHHRLVPAENHIMKTLPTPQNRSSLCPKK